jgi:MFS family permease
MSATAPARRGVSTNGVPTTGASTIGALPPRKAMAFLSLFFFPATAQAILLAVVPLEALHLVGTARAVTLVYVAAGLAAVAGRFTLPFLVRLIQRRFVLSVGALLLAAGAALMAADRLDALAAGLALSTFAFACIEVTSQLHLLDNVSRHELRHFEPLRIFASAGPWTLGPWFGVYLQHSVSFAAPFAITMAAAAALLAIMGFWVSIAADVRERRAGAALLAALGVTRRGAAVSLCLEKLLLSLPSAALGVLLGTLVARLLVPAVTLSPTARQPTPPALTLYDLPQAIALALVVAIVPVVIAALAATRRPDPAADLRAAEAA